MSSVHLSVALAEPTTTTKNLKHDNRSPGRGTNLGYAECEAGAGVTPLRIAVFVICTSVFLKRFSMEEPLN